VLVVDVNVAVALLSTIDLVALVGKGVNFYVDSDGQGESFVLSRILGGQLRVGLGCLFRRPSAPKSLCLVVVFRLGVIVVVAAAAAASSPLWLWSPPKIV